MEKENNPDKKNMILLTIIAIATLLVAMVGATFAYFTAQRGKGAQADITVKTSTSDTLEMGSFDPLTIVATQQNFGENKGTRSGEAHGEIKLTANDAEATQEVSYCYTADLVIKQNQFMYSKPEGVEAAGATTKNNNNDPELVVQLFKTPNVESGQEGSETEYTIDIGDGENALKYISNIIDTNVCTGDEAVVADPEKKDEDVTCPKKQISGYDITEIYPTKNEPIEPDGGVETYSDKIIKIPILSTESNEIEGNNFVHKITAKKGLTTVDKWRAVVYFVNYDYDQEKNTGKVFNGILKFTTVDCGTGEVPEP